MFLTPSQNVPFDIKRASHLTLTAADLDETRRFYTEVLGMVASDQDDNYLYLRGVEERAHHSLTFHKSSGPAHCERVGMRVAGEQDLVSLKRYFEDSGLPAEWATLPYQGKTLLATDPSGILLEFVASMETRPRLNTEVHLHRGAATLRMDHYQITVPHPVKAAEFYAGLGYRVSDYYAIPGIDHVVGIFMHRKGTPYDIVLFEREGPRVHHFGVVVTDLQSIIKACDCAGNLGYGNSVEYGPGRHALGHGYYVYFRDPDGHRSELLLPPIELLDSDDKPVKWELEGRFTESWGLPPQKRWFTEATPFKGVDVVPLPTDQGPVTLERFLAMS